MAIFTQAVANTVNGHFLYSSIKGGINLLGDHFSPALAALAIPYSFYRHPETLLILQAFAVSCCIFPIFKLASFKIANNRFVAYLFALSFVLYLPVRNANRFDFHPELLAMPLLLWAYYFLQKGRFAVVTILLLISLSVKETAALVTFGIGLHSLLFCRRYLFGLLWMAGSTFYFLVVVNVVIPHFSDQNYAYLSGNFFVWMDKSVESFLSHLFSLSTVSYLFKIYAPLGFLSFLSPSSLIMNIPILAQNILSRNDATRSIFFQYTALLTPFVFISAIEGAARLKRAQWLPLYLTAFALMMTGVPETYIITTYAELNTPKTREIRAFLKSIPASFSVRTHEFYASQTADRNDLHIYENEHPKEGASVKALKSDIVAIDEEFLGLQPEEHFKKLKKSGYKQIYANQSFRAFSRQKTQNNLSFEV